MLDPQTVYIVAYIGMFKLHLLHGFLYCKTCQISYYSMTLKLNL